jgi:hypothetical protein
MVIQYCWIFYFKSISTNLVTFIFCIKKNSYRKLWKLLKVYNIKFELVLNILESLCFLQEILISVSTCVFFRKYWIFRLFTLFIWALESIKISFLVFSDFFVILSKNSRARFSSCTNQFHPGESRSKISMTFPPNISTISFFNPSVLMFRNLWLFLSIFFSFENFSHLHFYFFFSFESFPPGFRSQHFFFPLTFDDDPHTKKSERKK